MSQLGKANLKIGEHQTFLAYKARVCYLDFLKRYLVQAKDFHSARKKLESRRQAYESLLQKSFKEKKEDSRLEEDIRLALYKFEESTEQVKNRMIALKDVEADQYQQLTELIAYELNFFKESTGILNTIFNSQISLTPQKKIQSSERSVENEFLASPMDPSLSKLFTKTTNTEKISPTPFSTPKR